MSHRSSPYESLVSLEFVYYFFCVAMLSFDRVVQSLHLLVGNLSRQLGQDLGQLRMPLQSLRAYYRHRLIRRKIMSVVFQHEQTQSRNQPVGRIAAGQVDLVILSGPREQAQFHNAWLFREAQAVGCDQTSISIRTLHELIAEPGAPLWSKRGRR